MNIRELIRILYITSSALIVVMLSIQVLKIKFQFLPEKLLLTPDEVHQQALKDFYATDKYSSFEIVDKNKRCSPGYHSVLKIDNQEKKFCKCGYQIYPTSCSSVHSEIIKMRSCESIKSSSAHQQDYEILIDKIHRYDDNEVQQQVKLCGKKLDHTKITYFTQKEKVSGLSFYKYCTLKDSYKLGLVETNQNCPSTNASFYCKDFTERKCETKFFVQCLPAREECPDDDICQNDEIGCISGYSSFCVKNTEQCPITDVLLTTNSTISSDYEQEEVKITSPYKLIVKRNDVEGAYIESINVNTDYLSGSNLQGFYDMTLDQFLKINELQISANNQKDKSNIISIKKMENYQYTRNHCKEIDRVADNSRMMTTYEFNYETRIWIIRLFLVKLFFDFIALAFSNKSSNSIGRSNSNNNNSNNNESDQDLLGKLLDKINLRFFFVIEVALLLLLPRILTREIGISSELNNCLEKLNKYDDWVSASYLTNVNNDNIHVIILIVLIAVTKVITLIALVYKIIIDKRVHEQKDNNPYRNIQVEESLSTLQKQNSMNKTDLQMVATQ